MQPDASISAELGAFASGFSSASVPADVIDRARLHLADAIGLAVAGSRTAFARSIVAGLGDRSAGPCTVLGRNDRLGAPQAALANGVAIHSDDFDDTMFEATVHPSGVIVATGLAAAEACDADASALLPALVVGYELLIRLCLVAPGALLRRGFHATSVCGVFAAAAVAARLMKLDAGQTTHALGIAGSTSSGVLEYLGDGSSMKRFHPGWAAMCGIQAAQFARAGADGPRFIFEGRRGLYASFLAGETLSLSRATQGLGDQWLTRAIAMKLYPMCHFIHAFADGALQLRETHGLRPSDIARVTCFIARDQVPVVCEPVAAKLAPRTAYEAKFSLTWCVAAALTLGHIDLDTFDDASIARNDVRELATRIAYEVDSDSLYPGSFSGRLEVVLTDGRRISASRDGPVGSAANPALPEVLWRKFRANVDAAEAHIDAFALEGRIRAFEGAASVRELVAVATTAPRVVPGIQDVRS
ncbi:MAG: MmgE/PrpD family protein [Burkholderiaceae bacterium]|nr:MmgE/PrpD family protein [Burkholderiaceae bacterium]